VKSGRKSGRLCKYRTHLLWSFFCETTRNSPRPISLPVTFPRRSRQLLSFLYFFSTQKVQILRKNWHFHTYNKGQTVALFNNQVCLKSLAVHDPVQPSSYWKARLHVLWLFISTTPWRCCARSATCLGCARSASCSSCARSATRSSCARSASCSSCANLSTPWRCCARSASQVVQTWQHLEDIVQGSEFPNGSQQPFNFSCKFLYFDQIFNLVVLFQE